MSKSLFDNTARTREARTPAHVLNDLINKYGVSDRVARSLPVRVAFARWYAFQRKELADTAKLAELLSELAKERDPDPRELTNAAVEALAILSVPKLSRVVAGLAILLSEPKSAA